MQLQSYKSYSFNCIELIHASARAQAKYIDQYLIQFDKYELKERLTAVPNYPALIFNRLDFSKFFSSCVEYTTFDVSKSSDFKELQDNLSLVTAVIEQVVPVKNMFTDKYKEVQHNVVDGLNKLNEIGTNFRGKSGVHSFLREVCEEIVKYNKTAKEVDLSGKENYYIYPDKIEKLCSGMIGVCEKYVFDFEVDNERIRVEIIATNLSNDIANLQSLFDQYMDVFKSMSKNLENTSVKIRSQCEKMSSHCLILKEYFGRKKVLKPIVLEFK